MYQGEKETSERQVWGSCQYLVGLKDLRSYFVEDHLQLLSCVVISDAQKAVWDRTVHDGNQQHVLWDQEHFSSPIKKGTAPTTNDESDRQLVRGLL